jgi:tetratricopeptide (TPR) repeat protein
MNPHLTSLSNSTRPLRTIPETAKKVEDALFKPQVEYTSEPIVELSSLAVIKPPLVEAKTLDKIPFATKPLPQGGEIVYLTPAEFKRKFGCIYSESLHGNKEELSGYLDNEKLYQALQNVGLAQPKLKDVYYRLNNPLQSAVICDMGEVGYGLFASEDIDPGTVLFMFAGQIELGVGKETIQDKYASYWLLGIDLKDKQFRQLQAKNVSLKVSPIHVGNLSRFMQHLPASDYESEIRKKFRQYPTLSKGEVRQKAQKVQDKLKSITQEIGVGSSNELDDIIFTNKNYLNEIAISNVQFCTMIINNVPVLVCWTETGIKKHEQIGFSYGINYWNWETEKPLYFDQMGAIISPHSYTYKSDAIRHERLNLFNQGESYYKQGNYNQAITLLQHSLSIDKPINQIFESDNAFYANCFSTLAYCYLKTNNIAIAKQGFERAIVFFYALANNSSLATKEHYQRQLEISKDKYYSCLSLSKSTAKDLYAESAKAFEQKQYIIAIYKLEYLLNEERVESSLKHGKKEFDAYCLFKLASCYQELGEIAVAIEYCKKALALHKAIFPEGHQLIKLVKEKLALLKDIG